jgi:hypothetical protein
VGPDKRTAISTFQEKGRQGNETPSFRLIAPIYLLEWVHMGERQQGLTGKKMD